MFLTTSIEALLSLINVDDCCLFGKEEEDVVNRKLFKLLCVVKEKMQAESLQNPNFYVLEN